MKPLWLIVLRHTTARCAGGMASLLVAAAFVGSVQADPISAERRASLDHLLRHDCGSCHGMTLQGGLGPALLPEQLADWDIDGLVAAILAGNPERAMPAWDGLLSDAEARYLAERIKKGVSN